MCAEPIDYSGATTGVGVQLQFTPDAGGSASPIIGLLTADGIPRTQTVGTFTPLSDGVERVKQGKHEATSVQASIVYAKTIQTQVEAMHGVMGTYNLIFPDGTSKEIGHGFMSSIHITNVSPDNVITADITINFDGNRQYQAGT